jgi:hypothetical protein
MMLHKLNKMILLIPVLTIVSCMYIKQPPLTLSEKNFFDSISKQNSWEVEREIDPRTKEERLSKERTYTIIFGNVNFGNRDSSDFKDESYRIAKTLHNKILRNDFKFDYQSVLVSYYGKKADGSGRYNGNISFEYQITELH